MHYEVYTVTRGKLKGQYRFRLVADNGKKIIPPESYHNLDDLLHAINLIKGSTAAPVVYPAEG